MNLSYHGVPVAISELAHGMNLICHLPVDRMKVKFCRGPHYGLSLRLWLPKFQPALNYHTNFFIQPVLGYFPFVISTSPQGEGSAWPLWIAIARLPNSLASDWIWPKGGPDRIWEGIWRSLRCIYLPTSAWRWLCFSVEGLSSWQGPLSDI